MPKLCEHCGKMHATQEELEGTAQGGLVDPTVDVIGEVEPARGDEGLPSPEPLPHEILAGEAPEEISEEYAPKRFKVKKTKKS